jgi:hypothetical protein
MPFEVPSASVPSFCLLFALHRAEAVAENTFLERDGNIVGENERRRCQYRLNWQLEMLDRFATQISANVILDAINTEFGDRGLIGMTVCRFPILHSRDWLGAEFFECIPFTSKCAPCG